MSDSIHKRLMAFRVALVFAALLLLAGCGARNDLPKIILVSIDTLRSDVLGAYGAKAQLTPVMDVLAKRGVRFSDCRTAAPWTLPAHASMLSGRYPTDHRAVDDKMKIRDDAPMMAEVLRKAGYKTAGFVSHYYVSADFGFQRGFDEFTLRENAPADQIADLAIRWMKTNGKRSFFLFLHFFDPHTPYTPPPSIRARLIPETGFPVRGDTKDVLDVVHGRYGDKTELMLRALRALYGGEVNYVDLVLGRVLEFMQKQQMKNTIIILTGDHGEEFMEHRLMEHGFTLYDEQLRVPLIIYWPERLPQGLVSDAPASLIDLLPTVAELAGAPAPAGLPGKSLVPLMAVKPPDETVRSFASRSLLAETSRQGPDRVCLIRNNLKYTYSPVFRLSGRVIGRELFDLSVDPGETNNLIKSAPSKAKEMLREIEATNLYAKKRVFSLLFAGARERLKYLGTVTTPGSFISAWKDDVIYDTDDKRQMVSLEYGLKKEENRLHFLALGSDGDNGLHFMVEPESSAVNMDLLVDGARDAKNVLIGDAAKIPDAVPFTLPADLAGARAFPRSGAYRLWCEEILANRFVVSRFEIGDQIEMSPEMKSTLKSLGYLDDGGVVRDKAKVDDSAKNAFKFPTGPVDYRCAPLGDE